MRKCRVWISILALLLVVMMLASCETAIDKSKDYLDNHKPSSGTPMVTINMYLPHDGTVSNEAVLQMQAQFNAITEAKYNTHVVFHMVASDQYADYLKEVSEDKIDAYRNGAPTSKLPSTVVGVDGVTRVEYPEEADAQMDIFVVNGLSMLNGYVNKQFVYDMTASATSKYYQQLSSADPLSISESIFWNSSLELHICENDGCLVYADASEVPMHCPVSVYEEDAKHEKDPNYTVSYKSFGGKTTTCYLGIPSNSLVGEYTYLVIPKSVSDRGFIGHLLNAVDAELTVVEQSIVAQQNALERLDTTADNYASERDTILKKIADIQVTQGELLDMREEVGGGNVPLNAILTSRITVIKSAIKSYCKAEGISETDVSTTLTGDYRMRESYGDSHYVIVTENPVVTDDDIYEGMFCISRLTANADRAMQILVELNTNSELHTILQYGAKDVHYTLTEGTDGNQIVNLIDNPSSVYKMDHKYTGNISRLYACPQLGYDVNYAYYLYLHNANAVRE